MSPEIPLAAVSLTWREAPSRVRDAVATPIDPKTWEGLRAQGAKGMVQLHTCARSLWLIETDTPAWAGSLWQAQIARRAQVAPPMRVGADALRFALRVSIGLDSAMQGEADIGRQFAGAVVEAREGGHGGTLLTTVAREAANLGAEGQVHGFVRPNRGLGALAVDELRKRGIVPGDDVAIVGSGAIGSRVHASLRRAGFPEPVVYNRTPRGDARPISALRPHRAVVVCTAGPARWLHVDAPLVIDLGQPPQVDGPCIGLDALLSGAGSKLAVDRQEAAEAAVEGAVARIAGEIEARRWRRRLGDVRVVRDHFLDAELESMLDAALHPLSPAQRKQVLDATRAAIRRYDHEVVSLLRDAHPTDTP